MNVRHDRPLSALLSQVLVAFTVELDNEFELRLKDAGYVGARLSLVIWANLLRFVSDGGTSVRELTAMAFAEATAIKLQLGCLERWGFVTLETFSRTGAVTRTGRGAGNERESFGPLRDGWGSGRGLNNETVARLTAKGRKACATWPPLLETIEKRWRARFGAEQVAELRGSLEALVSQFEMDLPQGLMNGLERTRPFGARSTQQTEKRAEKLSLPALLSQALLAFTVDFDNEALAPLWLCASTIRVLAQEPLRESEIPRLTGNSPETSGIGWQLKRYVIIESGRAAARGKTVRLSPMGLEAQKAYHRLTAQIEKRWESHFGDEAIATVRSSLEAILHAEQGENLLIAEGLVPPAGTVRAGEEVPALGRRDVGVAAKKRARDLAAQTEAFVKDPLGALPHYPLWDMNRGFGP